MSSWLWTPEKLEKILKYKKDYLLKYWALEMLSRISPEKAAPQATELAVNTPEILQLSPRGSLNHSPFLLADYRQVENAYLLDSGDYGQYYAELLVKLNPSAFPATLALKYPNPQVIRAGIKGYESALECMATANIPETTALVREQWESYRQSHEQYDGVDPEKLIRMRIQLGDPFGSLADDMLQSPDPADLLILMTEYARFRSSVDISLEMIDEIMTEPEPAEPETTEEEPDETADAEEDDEDDAALPETDAEEEYDPNKMAVHPEYLFHETLLAIYGYLRERISLEPLEDAYMRREFRPILEAALRLSDLLEQEARARYGDTAFNQWLQSDDQGAAALLMTRHIKELLPRIPEDLTESIAVILARSLESLARSPEQAGLTLDCRQNNPQAIMDAFLSRAPNSKTISDAGDYLKTLEGAEREKLIEACFAFLNTGAVVVNRIRAARLLADLADAQIFARLLRTPYCEIIYQAILETAHRLGTVTIKMISELLGEEKPSQQSVNACMLILPEFPLEETTNLVLKHWERLWSSRRYSAARLVKELADRRFLAPLRREIADDEELERNCYIHICSANGVKDSYLPQYEADIKRMTQKRRKEWLAWSCGDHAELLSNPVRLHLQCRACGRSHHYEINPLIIDPETLEYFPLDPVRCKHCRTLGDYIKLPENNQTIHRMLNAFDEHMDSTGHHCDDPECNGHDENGARHPHDHPHGPECNHDHDHDRGHINYSIEFSPVITLDGQSAPAEEIIGRLRTMLESDPQNPALLCRLAHALYRSGRLPESLPLFRQAAEINPRAMDPCIVLSEYHRLQSEHQKEFEYYSILDAMNYAGELLAMDHEFEGPEDVKEYIIPFYLETAERLKKKASQAAIDWFTEHYQRQ